MKPLTVVRGFVLRVLQNRERQRAAILMLTPRSKAETIHY
jgi:hypothetical protein